MRFSAILMCIYFKGDIIGAESRKNKMLYRAEVINLEDNQKIAVRNIDDGTKHICYFEKFRFNWNFIIIFLI